MTTDSLQPAEKPSGESDPESAVDPAQPYRDAVPPESASEDEGAGQREHPDLVDPAAPFTPGSHTGDWLDASAADVGAPPSASRHSPDELGVYEVAVHRAPAEDAEPISSADDAAKPAGESASTGLQGLVLMDGERIESSLNPNRDGAGGRGALLLTNRRLIQVGAASRRRSMSFVAVGDVDSAEVTTERRRYGGYVWGALSLFVAVMLRTIWEHPIGSVVGPIIVILMGVYLVIDQVRSPGSLVAHFKAGSSVVSVRLDGDTPPDGLSAFVNRLFELKEG